MDKEEKELLRLQEMSRFEEELWQQGYAYLAGFDEAGRGPLAGPVVAAAVILPSDVLFYGINDSKKLSDKKKEQLEKQIKEKALAYAVCEISPADIDRYNILQASIMAMEAALGQLKIKPDYLLTDAVHLPHTVIPQNNIIKGDAKSITIAAASILAKTHRDRLMIAYDEEYPQYGFAKHKGYPTKEHREAIMRYGQSPIHRHSFRMQKEA